MWHAQGHGEQICLFCSSRMFSLPDVATDRRRMEDETAIRREKMMKKYGKCLQMESGMLNIDFFFRGCVRRR